MYSLVYGLGYADSITSQQRPKNIKEHIENISDSTVNRNDIYEYLLGWEEGLDDKDLAI